MKKALPEKAEFFYIICIIFTRDGKYFFVRFCAFFSCKIVKDVLTYLLNH